jgi:methylglutaconyl-CoA hydratase
MKDRVSQTGAYTHLLLDSHGGIARLTLNRPDRRNAIDERLANELADVFEQLGQDPGLRCVVLSGAGPSFCAGADLHWLAPKTPVSEAQALQDAQRLVRMFRAIDECPCPVIGRVHGPAFGGGVGLVATCDIVVAAEDATFALSEARLGMVPAVISPFLLRKGGESFARRYCLTGEPFTAAVALEHHLVHDVVPTEQLDSRIKELTEAVLALAPNAVRETKLLLRRLVTMSQGDHWSCCTQANADARVSDEAKEGLRAFLEKRPAKWVPKK